MWPITMVCCFFVFGLFVVRSQSRSGWLVAWGGKRQQTEGGRKSAVELYWCRRGEWGKRVDCVTTFTQRAWGAKSSFSAVTCSAIVAQIVRFAFVFASTILLVYLTWTQLKAIKKPALFDMNKKKKSLVLYRNKTCLIWNFDF